MLKPKHLLLLLIAAFGLSLAEASAQESRVLTLEELFTLAEQNSKRLEAERSSLREAEARTAEIKAGRLPEIEISASASYIGNGLLTDRDFSNAQSIPMPHFGNNFAVEASQLIYGGGAVSRGIALARLGEEMASINLDATRSRVRFLLTGYYLELCKLGLAVEVYDRNIELAEELIADIRSRSREGVALENDITRQELRLQRLELARIELCNTMRILSTEIATTIGLDPTTEIIPDKNLLSMTLPATEESYWQEIASEHSYDLKRGELAVAMGEQSEKLARAERRPTIAVMAANNFDGPVTIEVPALNNNFNHWYVGIGVSFKISSLYKANRTIKREALATEHSRRELDDTRDRTTLTIHSDYIRFEEAFVTERTCTKSVELAESNYHVIETRYRNGIALVTDMIDASNQLLSAELDLTSARINILMRYFKLLETSGTL